MLPFRNEKLLLRLGLAMATITALAFVGMLSSVYLAETTHGDAGAINQAGTLRMQSYRIAAALVDFDRVRAARLEALIDEFEERLNSPRLAVVLTRNPDSDAALAHQELITTWERSIRPGLMLIAALGSTGDPVLQPTTVDMLHDLRRGYLDQVDGFVAQIDAFVGLLEVWTEEKIELLKLIHVVTLFLTIAIVFVTMYWMHTRVLLPLRDLMASAEAARGGDFSVRPRYLYDDELGHLGQAFNFMAEDLSKTYADLEARVQAKTADLEQTNRSLELLYTTTLRLSHQPLTSATARELLDDLERVVGIGPSSLCLAGTREIPLTQLASTWDAIHGRRLCDLTNCATCNAAEGTRIFSVAVTDSTPLRVLSIDISDQEQCYGLLLFLLPGSAPPAPWQIRLLETVARHIGAAITLSRRGEETRRLALFEERNAIARELHDSLAQSLSYMKIQASRLHTALHTGETDPDQVLGELRGGISSAYRQLRELLTTFRLQMDGRGLEQALDDTVREFRDRHGLPVTLDYAMDGCRLTPNAEIHVLQVIREALTNVEHHAAANQARVGLRYTAAADRVEVEIEDDGVGIGTRPSNQAHHYGLAIMEERARNLGGQIEISPRAGGGTRVGLIFTPPPPSDHAANGPGRVVDELA
jgi:two-component system nitrate/nitrite sensor histidine kinase NarX